MNYLITVKHVIKGHARQTLGAGGTCCTTVVVHSRSPTTGALYPQAVNSAPFFLSLTQSPVLPTPL